MKLKYRVVVALFVASLLAGMSGYFFKFAYLTIAGIFLLILGLSTLSCSDKDDQKILSILLDGLVFGLL